MGKTKFTPGPWEIRPTSRWIVTQGNPYGHGQMHVADARGWGHLTGIGACSFPEAKAAAIQDANAALIAAAPLLYEALLDLVRQLPKDERLADFNLDLAEAAMLAAEGDSNQ